jgi:hypothetical protein
MKKIILMLLFGFAVFVNNAFGQTSSAGFQMSGTTLVKYTGSEKEVTIPSNVTSIGDGAFAGTSITYVNITPNVRSIGSNAFSACYTLTNLNIAEGVTSIGTSAFGNCESLRYITIPSSVTNLGSHIFRLCPKLESVTFALPSKVTKIPNSMFSGCPQLRSVNIPPSVTVIDDWAFADAWIPEITIPASVKNINSNAFIRSGLSKITFEGITVVDYDGIIDLRSVHLAGGIGTYQKTGGVWAKQAQTPAVPQEPVQTPNQDSGRTPSGRR